MRSIFDVPLDPYVADITPLSPRATPPFTVDGRFVTHMREKHESMDQQVDLQSAYAWIPAVFSVSADGRNVSLEGYINGLGTREQYPVMFKLVEEVFKVVMPILERTVCFDTDTLANSVESCECEF
jgi:hypothetical protein